MTRMENLARIDKFIDENERFYGEDLARYLKLTNDHVYHMLQEVFLGYRVDLYWECDGILYDKLKDVPYDPFYPPDSMRFEAVFKRIQ